MICINTEFYAILCHLWSRSTISDAWNLKCVHWYVLGDWRFSRLYWRMSECSWMWRIYTKTSPCSARYHLHWLVFVPDGCSCPASFWLKTLHAFETSGRTRPATVSHPRRRETTIVGGVSILTSWRRSACPIRSLYVQITGEWWYAGLLKQEWHKLRMEHPCWHIIHTDLKNLQLQPTHFLNTLSKLRLVSAQSLGLHQTIITRASGYI